MNNKPEALNITEYPKLKIIVCAPAEVGKTELLRRITKSKFQTDYKLTVGVDIVTIDIELANATYVLSMWDLGCSPRFEFIRSTFYKNANGAIMIFDLSMAKTWDGVLEWYENVKKYSGDIPFLIVGNRLERVNEHGRGVKANITQNFGKSRGGIYIEVDSQNAGNLLVGLGSLVQKIVVSDPWLNKIKEMK